MSDTRLTDFMARLRPASPEEAAIRAARREREDAAERRAWIDRMLDKSGVPARHRFCEPGASMAWAAKLETLIPLLGRGATIVLTGERGTGKTQMAVALIRHTIESRLKPALFRTAAEFAMRVRGSYRKDSAESELQILEEHRRPALLVLDEIGRRQESQWENNMVFELLNARYADLRDTVMTCNLPRAEIETNLGPSVMSRMLECGGIVECNWPTFRA